MQPDLGPFLKLMPLPIAATNAVETIGPKPGTSISGGKRRLALQCGKLGTGFFDLAYPTRPIRASIQNQ